MGVLHATDAYCRRVPGIQPQKNRVPAFRYVKKMPVCGHVERGASGAIPDNSERELHVLVKNSTKTERTN
jgi:hypothetical protein